MLKRNLVANYLGQGWIALMGLAFIPVYIKYLGIEAYALIGLFAMLTAWLGLLDMGMTPTLSLEMARFTGGSHTTDSIRDLLRSIEIVALGTAAVIAAGVALSANWLATNWLKVEGLSVDVVAQAFAVMGLLTALRFVEGLYRSCIVGLQRQVMFNAISSVMATVRSLGAVGILAWVSPTIQAFFLWQGIVSVATLLTLALSTYAHLPAAARAARFSLPALRNTWRFAGGMFLITFLALSLTQVDKILLSKLLSLSEYGYYTLAGVVASALHTLITPIVQAVFPRLSRLRAEDNETGLVATFHQGAQLVTVVGGSAAIVLATFSDVFLEVWTQNPNLSHQAAPLLTLLVLGNLLNGLMWVPYQTQLAYGWTGLAVRINAIAVLIVIPAILWATPRYGAEGAGWVWLGLNTGYVLVGVHFMYRRILTSEKWKWYLEDIAYPLLAALVTVVSLRALLPTPSAALDQMGLLTLAAVSAVMAATLAAGQVRARVWTIFAPIMRMCQSKL